AASAATAIGPSTFCDVQTVDVLGWKDACAAIKVIVAFTWIGTLTFLVHLFTLLVLSLLHAPQSPGVWHSGVRDFPWMDFAARPSFRNSVSVRGGVRMESEPNSPAKYHYERRMTGTQPAAAPVSVPAQPAPVAPIHERMTSRPSRQEPPYVAHPFAAAAVTRPPPAHERESAQVYEYKPERNPRAKTQSQAIIEQFRSGQTGGNRSGEVQSTVVRALPRAPQPESQGVRPLQLVRKLPEPQQQSLYPVHVASTMTPSQTSTISYGNREPQPLGEWPRRNPPSDPRRQRNAAPPAFERYAAAIPSAGPMTTSGAQERVTRRDSADSYGSSGGSVDSDGVPRRKDGRPKHRPPPLDFSKLNAGRQ
ncbi:hypothetical protein FRC09_018739, partial [Ceratobasidium sp. 395]